ncbi:CBS domain-containing protein [Nocardioides pyridinolyticus]
MLVRDVMTTDPVTVRRRTTIKSALTTLAEHAVTALPVLDASRVVYGIVSEADLIAEVVPADPRAHERLLAVEPLTPPRTVEEVCTRSVVSVHPAEDVATAADLMAATGAKSLPVLDEDHRLVGMVSRSDIVAALARADSTIAADITDLLRACGHPDWIVEVDEGAARITGPRDAAEHSLAHTVARTVPGVVQVLSDR